LKYSRAPAAGRTWLHEEKVRIVAEIASSGNSVCEVARRHGLSPQQLFGRRRRLRDAEAASAESGGLEFVPAVVDADPPAVTSRSKAQTIAGKIEVEIGDVKIRIGRGADAGNPPVSTAFQAAILVAIVC
jgi:transposase